MLTPGVSSGPLNVCVPAVWGEARELSEVTWRNWLGKGLGPARSRSCWETCNAKDPGKDTGKREHGAAREGCSTWEHCLAGGATALIRVEERWLDLAT